MPALDNLQRDPRTFLWQNAISIVGNSKFGAARFQFSSGNMGFTKRHNPNEKYTFMISPDATTENGGCNVWNVPMIKKEVAINYADVPHTHVTGIEGRRLIVTGMLTGCTIAIVKVSDTELRVAHVQPGGVRPNAAGTEAEMREDTKLNNTSPTHWYGPSKYRPEAQRAHFIGVAIDGAWQLWGQCFTGSGGSMMVSQLTRIL